MTKTGSLLLRFSLPLFVWLLVYFESIQGMISVWNQSKTYEHCFLIVPVCLWVVWQDKEKFNINAISGSWLPVAGLVLTSLLWIIGRAAGISFFEHVAAVVSLQLIIWALLGNSLAKAFYFPICYLVFCIPFGEELIPYLQKITADISVIAVQLTGIPIYREGLYLYIPNGQFEVAEACSGIRFLISSIALGTLFAYMFFSKWWKVALFITFSMLFPILANGIRAYGIIIIGHLSDMEHATGADHLVYGWFFFSILTIINFSVASLFQDKQKLIKTEDKAPGTTTTNIDGVTVSTTLTLIIFFVWELFAVSSSIQEVVRLSVPDEAKPVSDSGWGITFPQAQQSLKLISDDNRMELYTAGYSLNQPEGELISWENQLFDKSVWSLVKYQKIQQQGDGNHTFQVTSLDVVNLKSEQMKVLYWYCIEDYCSNNKLKLKLEKAYRLLSGNAGQASVRALASSEMNEEELLAYARKWMARK